jgi:hypothetical protein
MDDRNDFAAAMRHDCAAHFGSSRPRFRVLMLPALLALVVGVLAGLARLGWEFVPPRVADYAAWHGALMITGFFGTVVGMEKAVAHGGVWPYIAPLLSGACAVVLLAGGPITVAAALAVAAACVFYAIAMSSFAHDDSLYAVIAMLGAFCWLAGNAAWLVKGSGNGLFEAWLAFIVLVIAGERLELSRSRSVPIWAHCFFGLAVLAVLVGSMFGLLDEPVGSLVFSAGLLGLALWLLCFDGAPRKLGSGGLSGFIAVCLSGGYVFLAFGAIAGLGGALEAEHRWRDTAMHAITVGFIFSMVLGHALIVLPTVARIHVPFGGFFYLPLATLHLSLVLRIAGAMLEKAEWVRWGALGNGAALALFALTVIVALLVASTTPRSAATSPRREYEFPVRVRLEGRNPPVRGECARSVPASCSAAKR